MRVFDDGAFHLPVAGIVRIKDFETGEETLMDAGQQKNAAMVYGSTAENPYPDGIGVQQRPGWILWM